MITRTDIIDVWAAEPRLAFGGFTDDLAKARRERGWFLECLPEIQLCHDWIMAQERGRNLSKYSPNSYTLKHYVEWEARRARIQPDYVSNGCFIAAAIISGVLYHRIGGPSKRIPASPNAVIGIKPVKHTKGLHTVGPYIGGRQFRPLPAIVTA